MLRVGNNAVKADVFPPEHPSGVAQVVFLGGFVVANVTSKDPATVDNEHISITGRKNVGTAGTTRNVGDAVDFDGGQVGSSHVEEKVGCGV